MSQKQLKTYKVINSFIDKSITRQHAAELLGLSTRQITRLKKGILSSGPESLIHKNTSRKPAHAFTDEKRKLSLPSTPLLSMTASTSFISKKYFRINMISLYHTLLLLVYSKTLEFIALRRKKSKNVPTAANESLMPASLFRSMPLHLNGSEITRNSLFMVPSTMPPVCI